MSNNEPAFPSHGTMGEVVHEGMTMRDYFAATAMQGELAAMQDPQGEVCGIPLDTPESVMTRLSRHWYRIADAMLKAREEGSHP